MAHLTSDFCPCDSFDDYSTLFGTTISDPNPLVKEELPPPMTEEEMRAMMDRNEPQTLHSVLRRDVNALECKYKVDTIPAEDLRVWKAAMTDAHLEFASQNHKQWLNDVEKAREEVENCKNEGRKERLETCLKRLETEDSRSNGWELFLQRHKVTEDELKDHPMYKSRETDETVLHPLALMVKRYREAYPLIQEISDVDEASDQADKVSDADEDDNIDESKKDNNSVSSHETKEEVPKGKSWFPSIW